MRIAILILLLFSLKLAGQQTVSKVWVADNGDGTYKNPIIDADYSDPDAIRVGDDYYMVSSSFTHIPGLPILHSKDLVNWTIIGHALKKQPPNDVYDKVQHGAGVWAPSIRYHNNEFYIYYPDPDFGIYLVKAKNILGPWTEPLLIDAGKGLIDPCPLWDDTGKTYLVHAYAGSRAGFKSIIVVKEMNKEGTKIIDDGVMVYDGHKLDPTIEGPKFYKRNGYYYIFAPAGGVSTGWQTVLRSKNVYGPYERKVAMDQGTTSINGPHQGAWVTTQTGEDWFLHFQDKDAYGRVVHLQPMKWVNDWPVIGVDKDGDGKGEPTLIYKKPNVGKQYPRSTVQDSDEFNGVKFGLQWQWQANPKEGWTFGTPGGSLRMFSVYQPDSIRSVWNYPNILAQKFPAEEFSVTVKISFKPKFENERFGLVILGTDYAVFSVIKKNDGVYIVQSENINADKNKTELEISSIPVSGSEFSLKVKVSKGGVCDFSYQTEKGLGHLLKTFTAKPGRWVGAKVGMFCSRTNITNDAGFADIDWIHFEK
ncbi:MAG TPA: glycoside hydrolase 43 family protein [Chitinophagaceae bacterium]|nr:glycoside hydrolase 43 family protein [Chitinophagaceae bacterium]